MTKIALLSFVILVAGCASQEERLWQQDARDDSTCKKSFPHGTESYWKCRSQLDQMHAQQQYAAGPFDMVVRGISAVTGAVGSVR
jgi:hypothetical protein